MNAYWTEEAIRALVDVKKDDRTLKVLIAACGAPEKNIRLHALRALANSKSDLAAPALKLASLDTDEDIQYEANRSLASIQKLSPSERRKHHEEEQEAPQNDPHKAAGFYPSSIDTLAESIKNTGPSQAPRPTAPRNLEDAWIDDLIKSSNPESRIVAARGLGYTKKNKAAAQALIQAIKDPEPQVRIAVAEALGKIGYRKSIEVLKLATKDPDEGVRFMAKRSLKTFE
jgi:HEAT repeat protein